MPILSAVCVIRSCGPPNDYLRFKSLPPEEQKAQFKGFPIDKQIDYFLRGQAREPPPLDFDEQIAGQGRSVLPDLLRRLRAEPEDYRRVKLIWVIEVMHKKYAPVNDDREVIDTVEGVVKQMHDPVWLRMSQKSLDIIKAHPDAPVPRPIPFPDPRTLRG